MSRRMRADEMVERLKGAGVDVQRPWREILCLLSKRGSRGLPESGAESLEDVVRLAFDRPGELRSLKNVGRVTVEEIRRHVRELAEGGYDGYLYRGPRPASLAETVAAILAVDDGEGGILRERFYEGRTLTQISQARSISRQWTCLQISRAIGRARVRFSDVLSPQLSPVLADAEVRGGLLDCHALDGLRPGEIRLALKVAGHEG